SVIPPGLHGMRTLFNGFHQFAPEQATALLHDAVEQREPIAVMELLQRSYADCLFALVTPLLVWGLTPWMRPFSWTRLLWTYVLPVVPLVTSWETLVSMWRCYTPQELRCMARDAAGDDYLWFADSYRYWGAPVTFLIGYPRDSADPAG
ncbi:MAG: hypothetical protein L0H19_08870, partial [Salinisphaera sp.]|nr:hypothetical protein [Salinisphaera sp.]